MRVVHIALFHSAFDVRIFEKECRDLVQAGYDVHLIVPAATAKNREGVSFHGLHDDSAAGGLVQRLWLSLRRGWRAFRVARSLRPHVVHLHEVQAIPIGAALKAVGTHVIYDAHEDVYFEKITNCRTLGYPRLGYVFAVIGELLETLAKILFDGFVAATPYISTKFPRRRVAVVQNFPRKPSAACNQGNAARAPSDRGTKTVLYAGNLFVSRGAFEMVQAMQRLPPQPPAELLIAGRFVPEDLIDRLKGLAGWERVRTLGWLDREALNEIWQTAQIALILFHPRPEHLLAYPNKLFEAMAAGVPVIASDFPLWRRIVEQQRCGIVVDPLDPQAIADAIEFLLSHPEEADAMGKAGRTAVISRFNWENESEKLIDLYRRFSPRTKGESVARERSNKK